MKSTIPSGMDQAKIGYKANARASMANKSYKSDEKIKVTSPDKTWHRVITIATEIARKDSAPSRQDSVLS